LGFSPHTLYFWGGLQNLIDLAGSEKVTTNIDRKREGGFINRSLLTLGTVIAKISEGKGFVSHLSFFHFSSKLIPSHFVFVVATFLFATQN